MSLPSSVVESSTSPEETSPVPALQARPSWPTIKTKLERSLRPLCLRWGKPEEAAINQIVRHAVGEELDEDDWLYRKAVFKCHSNITTWKNRTLDNMAVSTYFP
jgi:hypothetical protein